MTLSIDDVIPRVAEGVFFSTPPRLPRGKHTLSRAEVAAAHRERLCIAVTELLAAGGYRSVGVKEIAGRAQVSLAAFYACFDSKDEAIFAAYDRFIAVLIDRLTAVPGGEDWDDYVERVMSAYLRTLASDVVAGRAFQVEMDALGRAGRARRRDALHAIADLLHEKHAAFDAQAAARLPGNAYVAAVYGVRQLACDELDRGPDGDVEGLVPQISQWVSLVFAAR